MSGQERQDRRIWQGALNQYRNDNYSDPLGNNEAQDFNDSIAQVASGMRKLVMKVELALETRGRQDVDKASGLEDTVVTELLQTMTTTAVYTVTQLFAEKPNTEATNGLRAHAAFALTLLSVSHVFK